MSGLRGRLGRVARTKRIQGVIRELVPPMVLVSPGEWPHEDAAAYRVAEGVGDREAMDALVERHTGHRPAALGSGQVVILVREVPIRPRGPGDPGDPGRPR